MNPMPVPGVAMPGVFEQSPRLSPDELTIYFSGYGGSGGSDANLYIARRSTRTDAFDTPMPIPALNTSSNEFDPTVSTDSLSIWFSSDRIQQQGSHLYISTRTSAFSQFGMPGLATINASDTTRSDSEPFLTLDGQELWFISDRSGGTGFDIWRASRVSDGFAAPSLVPELSSMGNDFLPTLSADRLTVYFASDRVAGGTQGGLDIWTAHRSTVGDGFPMPHLVDELNTTANDLPGWLSTDNCRLYGATMSASSSVLFIATRQP